MNHVKLALVLYVCLGATCYERCGQCQTTIPADSAIPPARVIYQGRRIAKTMHYSGAEWLIRNEREREERCSHVLKHLSINDGMTVCDMGCGNGFYTIKMAHLAGPQGRVLAVDVQPEMLDLLRNRLQTQNINNVTPILGSLHNPRLPDNEVDLILLVDVYHEFSHPELMLQAMRKSLSPSGQIVLVEFREEDPEVPIKPLHKMSKQQILKELIPNGYQLVKEYHGLPWQHMMFFGRDEK